MAISVAYMDDLSRVRITGSSIAGATALVERSTDGVNWVTVRGGTAVELDSGAFILDDYEFPPGVEITYRVDEDTDTITVDLDRVWLKSIQHPFLNREIVVTDWSSVGREFRGGVFPIVGRSYPVAVTDLRGSRQYTLSVATENLSLARDLDYLLASGGPVFVHVPSHVDVPQMYAVITSSDERRASFRSKRRIFDLELIEVAAPSPDVVGATTIWESVLSGYSSWADFAADHSTWEDVLDSVTDPSIVLVD